MKKCKYCQSEIDSKAKICPSCRKKQTNFPVWLRILLIIFIIAIAIASAGEKETNNQTEEKFSYEVTNSAPDDANFAYYIEGTVTNNKEADYSYVQIDFVCYDKEGNNLGIAMDNTNHLLGKETWKFKAMGMFTDAETVDHCEFKEITGW